MNAVNPIVASPELNDHDIMERLEANAPDMRRRNFLKLTGVTGAGLVLGFTMGAKSAKAASGAFVEPMMLNAYVRIAPNGDVIIYAKTPEMGNSTKTSLPMIVAEQLDADWNHVRIEQAPVVLEIYGEQFSNGSRSIRVYSDEMHQAGATARAMLVAAAAQQWKVPAEEITTANSVATHAKSGKKATYGQLAMAAADQVIPDPKTLKLKKRADWTIIGTKKTGCDNGKVVTGQPLFGIDQTAKGLVYAAYEKCPQPGGFPKSFNVDEIKKMRGVKDAFIVEGNNSLDDCQAGVAIIADSTWNAFQAKKKLKVEWDLAKASKDDSIEITNTAREWAKQENGNGKVITQAGDLKAGFDAGVKTLEAEYYYPFLAHATLEPMNTTAWVHDGMIEAWSPNQGLDRAKPQVAKAFKVPEKSLIFHHTRLGGGFGRRGRADYLCEAIAIAQKVNGPVKYTWTREDDFAHDYYRAANFHFYKAAVDKTGNVSAWQDKFFTFTNDGKTPVMAGALSADEYPVVVMHNTTVSQSLMPLVRPTGFWRAPIHNGTVFCHQSFMHELALAGGREHVEFTLEHIENARKAGPGAKDFEPERAAAVVKKVAQMSNWGKTPAAGHALGFAFFPGNNGYHAEVAEISLDAKKKVTIHNIWAAIDCGHVINMSGALAQVEGSIIDGLSTMSTLEVTFVKGVAQQTQFGAYTPMRMPASPPPVQIEFIQSDIHPTGLGEPALPLIAPAICNAIFSLTGERIRTLPINKHGYTLNGYA